MGIPDHLICLLTSLYAGQEATVRTGHGTTDWFQIGKGVRQGCILSPCLFNLYAVNKQGSSVKLGCQRKAGGEQMGVRMCGRNNSDSSPIQTLMLSNKFKIVTLLGPY